MSDQERSPFARRGFIAAAIVVGAVALAAVVAIVAGIIGGGDSPAPDPSTPPSASGPSGADASVCGLPGFEAESSLTSAPSTTWELVGTMAAPTDADGSGPGAIESDGFRSCYAHTAEGALYAAANVLALGTDASLRPRTPELVAEGAGKSALEELGGIGGSSDGVRAQVAGFKVGAYSTASATIDLALNFSDGRLVSYPVKLTWEDGDWKIVVTDSGGSPLESALLQSLGGYIPWSGA